MCARGLVLEDGLVEIDGGIERCLGRQARRKWIFWYCRHMLGVLNGKC